jgi:hypothetical protein
MSCRESFDTIPGFRVREQFFTFIFSQPQNANPSFVAQLLNNHQSESQGETLPMPVPILHENQWHKVMIKITKRPLDKDIDPHNTGDFLNGLHMGYFSTGNFFLTPESVNLLLDRAVRNHTKTHGRVITVQSGLLFTRKLLAGEKIFMMIFSIAPTKFETIEKLL